MARRISPRQLQQRLAAAERDYQRVKQQLDEIGFICEGSLVQRWMPCGKPGCRCVDPEQRHGPYWQLSWKENGKTVSRRLSPQHAALYQEWIANRRRLQALIDALHDGSSRARQDLLDAADTTAASPDQPARQPRTRR